MEEPRPRARIPRERSITRVPDRSGAPRGANPLIRRADRVQSGSRGGLRQRRSPHRRSALEQLHALRGIERDPRGRSEDLHPIEEPRPRARIPRGSCASADHACSRQKRSTEGRESSDPPRVSGSERIETVHAAEAEPAPTLRARATARSSWHRTRSSWQIGGSAPHGRTAAEGADPARAQHHACSRQRRSTEGRGSSDPPRRSGSERIETVHAAEAKPAPTLRARATARSSWHRTRSSWQIGGSAPHGRTAAEGADPARAQITHVPDRSGAPRGADPLIRRASRVQSGSRRFMRQRRSPHRRSALEQLHALRGIERDPRGRSEDLHPMEEPRPRARIPRERSITRVPDRSGAPRGADPLIRRASRVQSGSRRFMRQRRSPHRRSALEQMHALRGIERGPRGRSEDLHPMEEPRPRARIPRERSITRVPDRSGAPRGADPLIRRADRVQSGSRRFMRQRRSPHRRSALEQLHALRGIERDPRGRSEDLHPMEEPRPRARESGSLRSVRATTMLSSDFRVKLFGPFRRRFSFWVLLPNRKS